MDDSLIAIIAPKGERKAAFMRRKGYCLVNCTFICDADMRIPTVEPMRTVSDHDSFVWRTAWLRGRIQAGRIANPGYSGYLWEPWLLTPVPGHPPTQTAVGQCTTAHAAMRLEVYWALDEPFPLSQMIPHPPIRAATYMRPTLSRHVLCGTAFGCLRAT
ncbi:hypothetical protein HPB49_016955 [Dermacentor silvarum]|uniref:Uncharacterized protein n=1 Tax=Dermacentor silvarum TaxID=543639 RepID=A0ACB8C4N2_DERSI|nr:hypothetical protein HPB49_016955 [Dermacentor silvarum]